MNMQREQIRVLMISKYFEPHVGGVEKHVLSIARELVKRGMKVRVLTLNFNGSLTCREKLFGIDVFRFSYPNIKFLGLLIIWFKFFFKYLNIFGASDLIHIHDVFIWYLPLRLIFPFKRVFVTFHGYSSYPLSRKAVFYQKLANKLVCGSMAVGSFIKKWFGVNSKIVTYGAVDDVFLACNSKQEKKILYDVIFLGRLEIETGGLFFLELVEFLRKRGFSPAVIAVGGGSLESKFDSLGVPYTGFVYNVRDFIDSTFVVFASGYLSILEGLSRKKLVVSSFNNPLRRDYIKMAPFAKWIFVSDDKKFLAEKIEGFLVNPSSFDYLISEAYEWVKNQTWRNMADDYERLWGLK